MTGQASGFSNVGGSSGGQSKSELKLFGFSIQDETNKKSLVLILLDFVCVKVTLAQQWLEE